MTGRVVAILLVAAGAAAPAAQTEFPWQAMARRIVDALQVERGERVMLRFDPATMRALEPEVAKQLRDAGATVESFPFGALDGFARRLERTDVYVWLPAGPTASTPPDQAAALVTWLDSHQDRRELHFHWVDGTRDVDGLPVPHKAAYDRVYLDALDIDDKTLAAQMDATIAQLREGEVRVTTPAGTDIRFRVGDRPFNRQTGDASKANARRGKIRIDRHTELPAGVLRVAPLESSVQGVVVLPAARFGSERATDVRLIVTSGVVTASSAATGEAAVRSFLASAPGASRFREFALGFNSRLTIPPGDTALPYYGYGAGMVRMSLGDNSELGGNVRGGGIRWLFFPDATVIAAGEPVVKGGSLVQSALRTGSESVQSALRTGSEPVQSRSRTGSESTLNQVGGRVTPRDERIANMHARDLGIPLDGTAGPLNAITDVAGIEVGITTLISGEGPLTRGAGPVRTGVTVVLPRGKTFDPVFAASYALNGNGEMTGTTWIAESGFLEGPLAITNTHSVGVVRDAVIGWMVERQHLDPIAPGVFFQYPLVAETWDGALNDINGFHVRREHVVAALDGATRGPVPQGNVGGGTGMVCMGFKGGTGTSSRRVTADGAPYTVGVLVQANFGGRAGFTVAGVPVGREITDLMPDVKLASIGAPTSFPAGSQDTGSIIVVVATDAPLLPHQLERLARRVPIGLGRVGGIGGNSSGDIFVAFSTANPGAFKRQGTKTLKMMPNDAMDPLFAAVIQSVEESVLNALVAAETMTGINGNTVHALPHGRLREVLRKYNRLR
jgi:L-aminopeptidase/D-esterase-like protein